MDCQNHDAENKPLNGIAAFGTNFYAIPTLFGFCTMCIFQV